MSNYLAKKTKRKWFDSFESDDDGDAVMSDSENTGTTRVDQIAYSSSSSLPHSLPHHYDQHGIFRNTSDNSFQEGRSFKRLRINESEMHGNMEMTNVPPIKGNEAMQQGQVDWPNRWTNTLPTQQEQENRPPSSFISRYTNAQYRQDQDQQQQPQLSLLKEASLSMPTSQGRLKDKEEAQHGNQSDFISSSTTQAEPSTVMASSSDVRSNDESSVTNHDGYNSFNQLLGSLHLQRRRREQHQHPRAQVSQKADQNMLISTATGAVGVATEQRLNQSEHSKKVHIGNASRLHRQVKLQSDSQLY